MFLADFKLKTSQRHTLKSLCFVVCPADLETLGIVDELLDDTELFLRSLSPMARTAVLVGTATFEMLAMAFPSSKGLPFSRLDQQRAAQYFSQWWHSSIPPFHPYAKGIKSMLVLAYYEHPKVQQQIGYLPEAWIEKTSRARLARFGDEIRQHEEMLRQPSPLHPEGDAGRSKRSNGDV